MATRRYRHGLAHYSPKRAAAARTRRHTPGPKQRAAAEKVAAAAARRRAHPLPSPRNRSTTVHVKERGLGPIASWPAEGRHLREQFRREAITGANEGYSDLYKDWLNEQYGARYRAQEKAHRATKPKVKGEWVRVKAHKRRRPR